MKVENAYDPRHDSPRKHSSLRKKFDIPIEHLDFSYIEKCTNERELEKILKILRSGEEGFFPDLEKFAFDRLERINPRNRALRVEEPVLKPEFLDHDTRKDLQDDLAKWLNTMGKGDEQSNDKEIFTLEDQTGDIETNKMEIPIRNAETLTSGSGDNAGAGDGFIKKPNPNRIKSWDYDKWEKFDVDTELTKLEIENLKREEEIKVLEKGSKGKEKGKDIPLAVSKEVKCFQAKPSCSGQSANIPAKQMEQEPKKLLSLGPSFIEEITEHSSKDPKNELEQTQFSNNNTNPASTQKPKTSVNNNSKRRVKVIIDDINIG